MRVTLTAVVALLTLAGAQGREGGDFSDSALSQEEQRARYQWFSRQMQPDAPNISCCGQADAYYAKSVVRNGTVYAVVTDERDNEKLGRPYIPVGTEFVVPPGKTKDTRADPNPTGETILFVNTSGNVLCFLPGEDN